MSLSSSILIGVDPSREEKPKVMKDFSVSGKQAIGVGGARGIGRGIALTLAEAGADVAIVALTERAVFDVATRASGYGVLAKAYTADATDGDAMDAALHQLPIWKDGHHEMAKNIQWIPLRPYKNWATDLKKLSSE